MDDERDAEEAIQCLDQTEFGRKVCRLQVDGKILNVRIRRKFAFVQYDSQEDATKALDVKTMSPLDSLGASP
ncbi:hypothetical protein Ancab_009601 [Ancistrocladus abbreviatus]